MAKLPLSSGALSHSSRRSQLSRDAGAIAAVIFNNEPGLFGGRLLNQADIPAVAVSQETGRAVKELMARSDVEATVSVVMSSLDSRNVVAETMAVQAGDRVVVLGGHFDTVPEVPGARRQRGGHRHHSHCSCRGVRAIIPVHPAVHGPRLRGAGPFRQPLPTLTPWPKGSGAPSLPC